MTKIFALSHRNIKEMVRDPLSLVFCLVFPVVMLVLMSVIFINLEFVPENFKITSYASGICVFGYTFTSLYIALQISADKNSSFIKRINISPIKKSTYLFSYFFSALPITMAQTILFFVVALCFGFPFDANFFLSIIYLIPSACLYIIIGILIGTICSSEKQTGPISSIFISLASIFGGVFMPITTLSGGFRTFVDVLPFSHTVQIGAELQTVGASCVYPHILWILGYCLLFSAVIVLIEKLRKS